MNTELGIVLGLLVSAIVMFAINKPRMDAVGLIMLTVLHFTGVITMSEAHTGFSDPNIVLIAALVVVGVGIVRNRGWSRLSRRGRGIVFFAVVVLFLPVVFVVRVGFFVRVLILGLVLLFIPIVFFAIVLGFALIALISLVRTTGTSMVHRPATHSSDDGLV